MTLRSTSRPQTRKHARYLVALVFALSVWTSSIETARAEGEIQGTLPASGGFALVVWTGGPVDSVIAAARVRQCDAIAVWTAASSGALVGYVNGAPPVVTEPFLALFPLGAIPPSTPLIVVCRAPIPPPTITYPQPGSPALIPIAAVTRGSASQLVVTASLPGLPADQRLVTRLRLCLRAASDECQIVPAPPAGGRDYSLALPRVGERAALTAQLCNEAGCGGYMHLAFVSRASHFYAIALDFGASAQLFIRGVDPAVARARVTYVDGSGWMADCAQDRSTCDTGRADMTSSRSATVEALSVSGAVLSTMTMLIRAN